MGLASEASKPKLVFRRVVFLIYLLAHGIGTNKYYKLLYSFVFYLAVMYAVPLTILTFTNYVLIRTILKRRVWRRKILPQNSR